MVAAPLSTRRRAIYAALALLSLFSVALIVTRVPLVWALVGYANEAVFAVERATLAGSSYMFGYLGGAPVPFVLADGAQPPLVIAFQAGGGESVHRESLQGRSVSLTNYRHDPVAVTEQLTAAGFHVHSTTVRDADAAHESTPQAFLMARR